MRIEITPLEIEEIETDTEEERIAYLTQLAVEKCLSVQWELLSKMARTEAEAAYMELEVASRLLQRAVGGARLAVMKEHLRAAPEER